MLFSKAKHLYLINKLYGLIKFIKIGVCGWRWETHLVSFCGANWQGIGNQQSRVLLLHYVDAGNWNYYLQEQMTANRKRQEKSSSDSHGKMWWNINHNKKEIKETFHKYIFYTR